jgi:microcystin-dependent protein
VTTFTPNSGLVVDPTGSNVGTWADNVTNPDFVAIDGLLAGVQTISVASTPVTLTSPATFTPTPGGGPTQAQNRVLRFTGTLTADVTVTLPVPGSYIIENLTTGNFVLSFRGVTATEVIGTPQGERVEIYNDGANVRFVGLARMGAMELWAGLSAMPAWVTACTVKPYLLADGTATYTFADFPALGARMGSTFGGNGITTFGVPDLRGRVPLAYDGTGTRITVAGCGLNGQTLGAANSNAQNVTLVADQIPSLTSVNASQSISVTSSNNVATTSNLWLMAQVIFRVLASDFWIILLRRLQLPRPAQTRSALPTPTVARRRSTTCSQLKSPAFGL